MNKFELKGEVVAIEVLKEGKVACMELKVNANNRTEVIPVLAFNKLSDVVAHYTQPGEEVEVRGALRLNNRTNTIDLVAFKITKTEQKSTKSVRKNRETAKKVTVEKTAVNKPVKKLDRFDNNIILNIYENISKASESVAVKKSDMKKAIANGTELAGYRWSY